MDRNKKNELLKEDLKDTNDIFDDFFESVKIDENLQQKRTVFDKENNNENTNDFNQENIINFSVENTPILKQENNTKKDEEKQQQKITFSPEEKMVIEIQKIIDSLSSRLINEILELTIEEQKEILQKITELKTTLSEFQKKQENFNTLQKYQNHIKNKQEEENKLKTEREMFIELNQDKKNHNSENQIIHKLIRVYNIQKDPTCISYYDFEKTEKFIKTQENKKDIWNLVFKNYPELSLSKIESIERGIKNYLNANAINIEDIEKTHTAFFTNGYLTLDGFVEYKKPTYKPFTINKEYKHIPINNPKRKRLQELLDLIFPNKDIQKTALGVYFTCLIPRCYEIVIFNIGVGSNGKSVLMNFLQNVIGDEYVGPFKTNSKNQFAFAALENKLMAYDEEGTKEKINVERLKEVATGGKIAIEKKGENIKQSINLTTMIVNTNANPNIYDSSSGTERRVIVIPYETDKIQTRKNAFSLDEINQLYKDIDYHNAFITIMWECFKSIINKKNNNFNLPEIIIAKNKNVLENSKPILKWLKSSDSVFVDILDDKNINQNYYTIPKRECYQRYKSWFQDEFSMDLKLNLNGFFKELETTIKTEKELNEFFFTAEKKKKWTTMGTNKSKPLETVWFFKKEYTKIQSVYNQFYGEEQKINDGQKINFKNILKKHLEDIKREHPDDYLTYKPNYEIIKATCLGD